MENESDDAERTRPPVMRDLMAKACGSSYEDVKTMVTPVTVEGVIIPFASPALLWKTKQTYREKDQIDRAFLRRLLEDRGEWPVE